MVPHVYNHKAEETEESDLWGSLASQLAYLLSSGLTERPCLRINKKDVATHTLAHVAWHLLVTKSQGLTLPPWCVAWPYSGKMFGFG